jgi:hypothetical protein
LAMETPRTVPCAPIGTATIIMTTNKTSNIIN